MPTSTFYNLPDAKRRRLVEAMTQAFARQPYSSVSVGEITSRAGVAKGSFYQYFTNKTDAYRFVVDTAMQVRGSQLFSLPDGTPFRDALRAFLDGSRQLQAEQPELYAVLARALTDPDAQAGDLAEQIRGTLHRDLVILVEKGIAAGELSIDLDADLAAYLVNAAFAQLGRYLVTRLQLQPDEVVTGLAPSDKEVQRIVDDLTGLLLKALAAS